MHWSAPRLLLAGAPNYDDPCRAGDRMLAYPALIDPNAKGRNFDDAGQTAELFFARMRVEGCSITADRLMLQQTVMLGTAR